MNKVTSRLLASQDVDNLYGASQDGTPQSIWTARRCRGLVIGGWIASMLGIAAYCWAMLDSGTMVAPYSTLFERGPLGMAAIPLLLGGVICWVIGSVKLLNEADRFAVQDDALKQKERYR